MTVTFDFRADPILGEALSYWNRQRRNRAMPARRDIDPLDVPRLLPNLQLVEVLEGGRRFRYRLVGTALVNAFGSEYTGKYLDELFSDERRQVAHHVFRTVCETRRPMFLRNSYGTRKNVQMVANRLYMPLSQDGRTVNLIMGCLTFEYGVGTAPGLWGTAALPLVTVDTQPVELELAAGA